MDRLGETELEDLGLEAALHDLRRRQTEDVIQLLLVFEEKTLANHAAEERLLSEHARLVLGVERQQMTGGRAHLGEGELHAPHLTLVLEAVLADDLHLGIEAILLERALRLTERLTDVAVRFGATHGCETGAGLP